MVEEVLDCDIFRFLAVWNEPSLCSEWLPNCSRSGLIKNVARNECAAYQYLSLPVISDREIILYGRGYDRLEKLGEIWIFGTTFHNDQEYIKKHNIKIPKNNSVKIDLLYHLTTIKILGKNKIHVKLVSNADSKMKWLPMWIINLVAKSTTLKMFTNIKKITKKFEGSVYEK